MRAVIALRVKHAKFTLVQVESKCEPRKPKQSPQKGALPFPGNISQEDLSYQPSGVEDLNKFLPSDGPQLSTPKTHPKVIRRPKIFSASSKGLYLKVLLPYSLA